MPPKIPWSGAEPRAALWNNRANFMIAQATKYDVSVEIPAKSLDINLEITFDDNLEINS
jgi:hypothetical protein